MTQAASGARFAGPAALAALAILAVASLAGQRADAVRMPPVDAVLAANEAIVDGFSDGDAYVTAPWWWEDGRLGLDGLRALPGSVPDPYERHTVERLWVGYEAAHPEAADAAIDWLASETVVSEVGGYRIVLGDVEPEPVEVLWDGALSVEDAAVTRHTGDRTRDCDRWLHGGWHCDRFDEFIFVGTSWRQVAEEPRRCIMANPPPAGGHWSIEWDDVPSDGTLRFRAGNTFEATRSDRGAPVWMRVYVEGDIAWDRTFELHDDSFDEVAIVLPMTVDETMSLRVEIGAADHFDRFFCFRPQVVRARSAN